MRKVAIIGCGGSGKTTLANRLGKITHIPVYHLDRMFWEFGWKPVAREEFIYSHLRIYKTESWIMDGNYGSTMTERLNQADTVIFLDFSTSSCLSRVTKRRFQYPGKPRPDMTTGNKERLSFSFLSYILLYRATRRPEIMRRLSAISDRKAVHILSSSAEIESFLTTTPQPE